MPRTIARSFLASLLALSPCAWSNEASTGDVFKFEDNGRANFRTIDTAKLEALDTIVLVISGSGCSDAGYRLLPRVVKAMNMPARYLALNKRYVKLGSLGDGGSEHCGKAFNENDTPRRWMADTMSFIQAQLTNDTSNWKKVVVIGTSEGGAIAASVARVTPEVTHLLVIGDGGWSMRDNLRTLLGEETVDRAWSEITRSPDNIEKMWLGHSYRYWFDQMDRTPLHDYLALKIPVLIAIGEHDRSVPAASAQEVLITALRAGKDNIGVVIYPGADHSLWDGKHSYFEEFLSRAASGITEGTK